MTQRMGFNITAQEAEEIAPAISAVLPTPLDILFDDVIDAIGQGDEAVYCAVGFGMAVADTLMHENTTAPTGYQRDLLEWHLRRLTNADSDKPHPHPVSRVVEGILRTAIASPKDNLAAVSGLVDALKAWATKTYER